MAVERNRVVARFSALLMENMLLAEAFCIIPLDGYLCAADGLSLERRCKGRHCV